MYHYNQYNGTIIPSIGLYAYIDKEIIRKVEKYDYNMLYYAFDGTVYAREKNREFFKNDYKRRKIAKPLYAEKYRYKDVELEERIEKNDIGKLIIYGRDLEVDVDGIVVFRKDSSDTIELTKTGCNKAIGISLLAKHLGISEDDIYVLGDEGNDREMLMSFKHSFLVDHPYNRNFAVGRYRIKNMLSLKEYLK